MNKRFSKLLLYFTCFQVFAFCASESEQVVARDFIPSEEVVWCKTNLKRMSDFYLEWNRDNSPANIQSKYSKEYLIEMADKEAYLKETLVTALGPTAKVNYLSVNDLIEGLNVNLNSDPDNYEFIKNSTDVCSTWYKATP